MATQVDLGKIRPVWKGDWAASTAYEQNDMVAVGVNSYICVTAHTSGSTFSDTNWNILAQGAEIPDQTGETGNYLTTDGTNMSWAAAKEIIQSSYSSSGYVKTNDGLIIQWNEVYSSGNTRNSFSFPITFPTGVLAIVATMRHPNTGSSDSAVETYSWSNSGAYYYQPNIGQLMTAYIVSVGY